MRDDRYCGTCGGRYGADIHNKVRHACANDGEEPQWCHHCGAELKDTGSCDNDHDDDEDNDVDDGPRRCPGCERPNQFGELCDECRRDGEESARDDEDRDEAPRLDEPWWKRP